MKCNETIQREIANPAAPEGADTPAEEIEITEEMIDAGLEAADLLSFRVGYTAPVPLVCEVYRAMWSASHRPKINSSASSKLRERNSS